MTQVDKPETWARDLLLKVALMQEAQPGRGGSSTAITLVVHPPTSCWALEPNLRLERGQWLSRLLSVQHCHSNNLLYPSLTVRLPL